ELAAAPAAVRAVVSAAEQSNTSIVYDDAWILKSFRKLVPGRSRDLELSEFLSCSAHFESSPALGGSIEYRARDGRVATLALVLRFVQNEGDGWTYALRRLAEYYAAVVQQPDLPDEALRASCLDVAA